jgi:signal transduction histidine kinase
VSATRLRGPDLLRAVAEGTAGAVGEEFLRSLVRSVAEAFGSKLVFVGEAHDSHVTVVAGYFDGEFIGPFGYDTEGQPCALIAEYPVVAIPEALTAAFPEDVAAADLGLESYLAVCLRASDGRHLGHLAVLDSRRMEAEDDDLAALRIFAARAAAELERRAQAAELEASRARVVAAADAERRRVGRDLHDGAQQRLLAVSNLLRVARKQVDGPGRELLDTAAEELQLAHAELRELARGLHPVALAERGLPEALASLTAAATVPVELEVSDEELREPVATAAYFLVAECLANAVRHASARGMAVRVQRSAEALEIEVADDGIGGADLTAGTGLRGLADRLDVLGGRLSLDSPPGAGTRVRATIPL